MSVLVSCKFEHIVFDVSTPKIDTNAGVLEKYHPIYLERKVCENLVLYVKIEQK